MADQTEQIQGRLNQREIPFKVVSIDPQGAVTFVPTRAPAGFRWCGILPSAINWSS
jgi:hypothetical protein